VSAAAITRDRRHTKAHRCPVCDGADGDIRGNGKRCNGFTTADDYAHCSREEHAGGIDANDAGLFAHRLRGSCKCGVSHGPDLRIVSDEIEATYDYRDEAGALVFQVVRKSGKRFLQRKPDGAGGWVWKLDGVRRVPYRLPELVDPDNAERTVYVVEGEKDADTLARRGFLATCNPGGSGKWHMIADVARTALVDREIVVVADADDVGRKHARDVEASLRGVAHSVRVVEPPKPHKDVTDLLSAGGTIDQLAAPDAEPVAAADLGGFGLVAGDALFAPLEPPDYVVDPLVRRGSLTLISAYGGSGKTWITLALLLAVATGKPFLGRFKVKQGRASFVDYESGLYEGRRRLQKLARGLECVGPIGGIDLAAFPRHYLTSADFEERITALAEERDVIAIDSLRAASPGVDENDSTIREGLDVLHRVAEQTGTAFVMIVHSKKKGPPGPAADPREMLRGSSAIFDAADAVLTVSFETGEPLHVEQVKARQGISTPPFDVSMIDSPDGAGIVLTAQDIADERPQTGGEQVREAARQALEVIRANPECSGRYVRAHTHGKNDIKAAALELLERESKIRNLGGARDHKWRAV